MVIALLARVFVAETKGATIRRDSEVDDCVEVVFWPGKLVSGCVLSIVPTTAPASIPEGEGSGELPDVPGRPVGDGLEGGLTDGCPEEGVLPGGDEGEGCGDGVVEEEGGVEVGEGAGGDDVGVVGVVVTGGVLVAVEVGDGVGRGDGPGPGAGVGTGTGGGTTGSDSNQRAPISTINEPPVTWPLAGNPTFHLI